MFRSFYHTPLRLLFTVSPEKGADTLVFLAEGTPGTDFLPGEYFVRRTVHGVNKQADDAVLARELWDRSEAMVGLSCESASGSSAA